MYTTTIYRKCPFCRDSSFKIELWNKAQDIWLLSCTNYNTSAGMWVTRNAAGRFYQIAITASKSNVSTLEKYHAWKRRAADTVTSRRFRKDRYGNKVATFINKRGVEEEIPDVPYEIRKQKNYGKLV